jgi:hypothetical protein
MTTIIWISCPGIHVRLILCLDGCCTPCNATSTRNHVHWLAVLINFVREATQTRSIQKEHRYHVKVDIDTYSDSSGDTPPTTNLSACCWQLGPGKVISLPWFVLRTHQSAGLLGAWAPLRSSTEGLDSSVYFSVCFAVYFIYNNMTWTNRCNPRITRYACTPRALMLAVNNNELKWFFMYWLKYKWMVFMICSFGLSNQTTSPHWLHTVAETFVFTIGNSELEYFSSTHSCSIIMMNSHIIT